MKAIILAAGKGSRLKNLTSKNPKCLLKFKGKTLLNHIIDNFLKNKINDINVVVGYKANKIRIHLIKKIYNLKWNKTNILTSLLCCNKILKKKTSIISYADIYYTPNDIKILKNMKGDICILSNNNWKKLWNKRFKNPLSDLESFKIKKNKLIDIGRKVKSMKDIQGQYMGLIKINPNGWKKVLRHIKNYYNNEVNHLDITNFLKTFIKNKDNCVYVKKTNTEWYEIDNQKDYKIAKKYVKK